MDYRKLGRSGLEVSELALGTMQFGWTADEKMARLNELSDWQAP